MTPLWKKLNLKDQSRLLVLNAPESFEAEITSLTGMTVDRRVSGLSRVSFAIVFVKTLAAIEEASAKILPKVTDDPIIWFAYPKGSSKRLKCEFNRDNGWAVVIGAGFETVRQVAIDEDWSALRFRRSQYVRK